VTLGDSPSDTFINFSAEKCWDMVLQRLNEEINKQGLHHLQPPQSINGLEMFGFFSPHIVQGIEALDPQHQCSEYWKHKFGSTENSSNNFKVPSNVEDFDSLSSEVLMKEKYSGSSLGNSMHDCSTSRGDHSAVNNVQSVMRGLFKKANETELEVMHQVFCNKSKSKEWQTLTKIIEEIQEHTNQ
ncbi:FY-rich, C-terminal, partial [Dillenia turbinata]